MLKSRLPWCHCVTREELSGSIISRRCGHLPQTPRTASVRPCPLPTRFIGHTAAASLPCHCHLAQHQPRLLRSSSHPLFTLPPTRLSLSFCPSSDPSLPPSLELSPCISRHSPLFLTTLFFSARPHTVPRMSTCDNLRRSQGNRSAERLTRG